MAEAPSPVDGHVGARLDHPVRGNQAAPAGVSRGDATWLQDLAAYDALPPELRQALQNAPFEADAAGVLRAYRLSRLRGGSELMAIAMTAGAISRFMATLRALAG